MKRPPPQQPGDTPAATRQPPRGKQARRGRALQRQAFLASRAGTFDQRALDEAMAARLASASADIPDTARALPTSDVRRWVPLGPSVVRRGQAEGRPRVAGRIRDLHVSPDGRRAYAASAKGGVWYTDDAGATWHPVGGWADRTAQTGGNNNARVCGCLLVSFGATPATDFVLVGTGEILNWPIVPTSGPPTLWAVTSGATQQGGVGVLASLQPAAKPVGDPVWEQDDGIALLEGRAIYRLARQPGRVPGKPTGADADRVAAATTAGLFLGTRGPIVGAIPPRNGFTWAAVPTLAAFVGGTPWVTDVRWLPGGPFGRLVVALGNRGVAFSDTAGVGISPWTWVTGLVPPVGTTLRGRLSLSDPVGPRLYVLAGFGPPPPAADTPTLWQIANITAAAPAFTQVPGVPPDLWGTQRDYDQALTVIAAGATDRVYLGGSFRVPYVRAQASASLWAFDVGPGPSLVPAPGVSTVGAPGAGDGADVPGLIGNDVHADVHAIRAVVPTGAPAGTPPHVWVGCDGGVFVSARGGRCNTFQARAVGLAVLEAGFFAAHPTSSHFIAVGCQDNGTQVRTGDTVWEATLVGDGGGVAFHPVQSQYLVAQYTNGTWLGRPIAGFRDPLNRATGGAYPPAPPALPPRESRISAFYAGAASVRVTATRGRIALGTNRVWLTDDLGSAALNTWRVLPTAAPGLATDPNPGATDPALLQNVGVPAGALGSVVQMRWASPTVLLALYGQGLVRYTEAPAGTWTATTLVPGAPGAPNPAGTLLTDVCPVPGTNDFYLVGAGDVPVAPNPPADTCWFFDSTAAPPTFRPTNLRGALPPLDPAYAVAVDPLAPTDVYVGTVTGVWRGVRASPAVHNWAPFVNGLPQATVQDLAVWVDPTAAAGAPRLLRAAVQSRGLWEVDLANAEPQRTYVRVHPRDDRRRLPTPMANPRRGPTAPPEPVFASPDVTVRPAANPAAAPTWQLAAAATMGDTTAPPYQLWTFQTAFRWHYPSITADGLWTDQLADLVELHRSGIPALAPGRVIDRALWNLVVGGTRLTAAGAISAAAADPLAVYRPPWQTPAALTAVATEVDLMETVVPAGVLGDVWTVYREPCTVDVLIHHRDTRPLAPGAAWAVLFWRSGPSGTALLSSNLSALPAFVAGVAAGAPGAVPAGWQLAAPNVGAAMQPLPVALDARLPRAVSLGVDLSAVPVGHRVLFVAVVGSTADLLTQAPVGAVNSVSALVRAWPYAAARLVRVLRRPP